MTNRTVNNTDHTYRTVAHMAGRFGGRVERSRDSITRYGSDPTVVLIPVTFRGPHARTFCDNFCDHEPSAMRPLCADLRGGYTAHVPAVLLG